MRCSPRSAGNAARVSLSSGGTFGDNTAAQIAQQTGGDGQRRAGFTDTALIGIAR